MQSQPDWSSARSLAAPAAAIGGFAAGALGLHSLLKRKKNKGSDLEWMAPSAAMLSGAGLATLASRGLTDKDAAKLQSFADINPDVSTDQSAAQFAKQYATKGHEALGAKVVGLAPTDIVRTLRTLPMSRYPWDAGSAKHYDEFAKSPDAALDVRMSEINDSFKRGPDGNYSEKDLATTGRGTVNAFKGYRNLINAGLTGRQLAIGLGVGTAAAGAGYALYKLLSAATAKPRKRSQPQIEGELKTAELSDTHRKAIKWLLLGGALAGAGYGAYKLMSRQSASTAPTQNQPQVAAPEPGPTAANPTAQAPATATVVQPPPVAPSPATAATQPPTVPATPKPDPRIEQFKQHWDSMPEWRRARAFKALQNEIGDPAKFKELGWLQRQKLKLMTGKQADQYGPNYGPMASFVLDNQDPEIIRQAYQIAEQNQGRDY